MIFVLVKAHWNILSKIHNRFGDLEIFDCHVNGCTRCFSNKSNPFQDVKYPGCTCPIYTIQKRTKSAQIRAN